ncbi:Ig domain-containing protein [Clostridium botulinum]|uniref:Ig-like domain-containing protein n=1 Tax=unclassified Clostridium TaxID=2614128 RepID=UPI0013CB1F3D|nr:MULTISPECIES: Ig-like domain-containing protein [unclassified Clostridium]NFM12024.1 Ig domain-containing protein [Clostridium botulinum]NFN78345.1 Ig domain-containing protein [Clostridium botulinum]NFO75745.1 Ig domain-containing protein [Clostridium botulinum]NFO79039.1 Ig domain-containing protein [Clostridium botulinum]NFP05905.1 Ig domain-containing protein [Clostridium botulinum]
MKNYFKKILVMFVMVLTIMGGYTINAFADDSFEIGTSNLNNTTENSAEIGDRLEHPEISWKRYDNSDRKFKCNGMISRAGTTNASYKGTDALLDNDSLLNFKFYGTKLRIIGGYYKNASNNVKVIIDGSTELFDCSKSYDESTGWQVLQYEKKGLPLVTHEVTITNLSSDQRSYYFDAIDIDDDGELLKYEENSIVKSISLDKSSLSLKENSSKNITATTTPSAVDVVWSSSDETIAKVDENGKVTGIKEGTCIITAQIKGADVKATCIVTVTKEDIVEPEEPSIENGSLYIEMIDGNIKRADKSQIEKFKKWLISRDLDETESPIFKITNAKGNTEYLVHDKVVGFEIRE